jgi:hypothetical protein
MGTKIISYGFAPGPLTKKDLEPAPEPIPTPTTTVQIVQQHPNSEKIIFMLGAVIIMLVVVIMFQNLGRFQKLGRAAAA